MILLKNKWGLLLLLLLLFWIRSVPGTQKGPPRHAT